MAKMTLPWAAMKQDFIVNGLNYKQISTKYSADYSTIQRRAAKERWVDQKGGYSDVVENSLIQLPKNATIEKAAHKTLCLLDRVLTYAETQTPMDTLTVCRQAAQTLKDLKDVRNSDLDVKEQMARIKRLEKELEQGQGKTVTIQFNGDVEELSQ